MPGSVGNYDMVTRAVTEARRWQTGVLGTSVEWQTLCCMRKGYEALKEIVIRLVSKAGPKSLYFNIMR